MTKKLPKRGLPPMHPGELLREEILPALDRPKTEIAKLLGVSRQTLYDILEERQPVTPVMALRLGKLCGNGPDLWLNLQKRYDLLRAEQELGEKIDAIPTLKGPESGELELHTTRSIGTGKPRSRATSAPYAIAARTFSWTNSGYCTNSSASVMPSARKSRISDTQMRVPLIQGLPPQTTGSKEIRSSSLFMVDPQRS